MTRGLSAVCHHGDMYRNLTVDCDSFLVVEFSAFPAAFCSNLEF